MMGGAAFTLLKAGCAAPKSAKQVEIRLAILPKILRNRRPGGLKIFLGGAEKTYDYGDLPQFPYDMPNSSGMVPFVS
jgi:hypothetical protein